jgi:hypothetical protein
MEISTYQHNQETKISLFPNPTTDYFQISGIVGTAKLIISNTHCKILMTKENISSEEVICVKSLPKGIYIAKIISNIGTERRKLEKK